VKCFVSFCVKSIYGQSLWQTNLIAKLELESNLSEILPINCRLSVILP